MKKLTLFSLLFALILSFNSQAQVPSYVPTSGLLGYFGFNGNATDAITGVSPTTNNAILTNDRFGNANAAYRFNGGQVIRYGSNHPFGLIGTSAPVFTINFWINSAHTGSNGAVMGSWGWGYFVEIAGGTAALSYVSNGAIWNYFNSTSGLHNGCWKMVTIANNGSSLKFYVNGILNNTYTLNNTFSPYTSTNNWFGANGQDNNNYYTGKIDDCGVWNRELTQAEIINLFQNYTPPVNNFSIAASNTGCGQTPTLDAGSGFLTYNWNTGATTQSISAPTNGSYSCTVTDNSCTYIASKQVTLINASIAQSANNICKNEDITLTASGGSSCHLTPLPGTLSNGLVGFWPFCGNASDASGNNNNGTVNGASLTTDRFGNANSAYSFDGVDDYVQVTNSPSINANFITISGWLNVNLLNNNVQGLVSRWNQLNSPCANYSTSIDLISKFTGACTQYAGTVLYSNTTVTAGNWIFFTYVHDASIGGKVYLNGTLESSNSILGAICSSTNNLIFGAQNNTTSSSFFRYFNGKLDDIAIYNRALTATEIQQMYALGNATYSWSNGAITQAITVNPTQTSTYTVTVTAGGGNCLASSIVNIIDTLTWTGAADTDWHKPCNWSPEFVPRCCNPVKIPLTTNQPIISGVAAAEDLTIYTTNGALLTLNTGANLQITDCPTIITTTACPSLAVLTTTTVSSITQTTAVSGGSISYQGASAITARGICWSTSINPTLANSFTSNGTGIGTFTSNLTGLTAGTTYYVRAYATNASGTSYGNQLSFIAVNPQPAYPANSVFCASGPTLVVDVTNPTTGKIWMDRNLGATQVATSSTDAAAYGDLYQWGRRSDGHQCRNSLTTTTLSSNDQPGHGSFILAPATPFNWLSPQNANLWQDVNGINNPCPSGYRLPTGIEIDNERISWLTQTSIGAYNAPLKWTVAGVRSGTTGTISAASNNGMVWSSSINGSAASMINFKSDLTEFVTRSRGTGLSVRCIKN
jgi:hypothetical protein